MWFEGKGIESRKADRSDPVAEGRATTRALVGKSESIRRREGKRERYLGLSGASKQEHLYQN